MKRSLRWSLGFALAGLVALGLGRTVLALPASLQIGSPGQLHVAKGVTFKLQLQCSSNGVAYLIQSSTNLTDWQTVLSVKAKPGEVIPLGDWSETNKARFYKLVELGSLVDTNPPTWSNGLNGRFSVSLPGSVIASWDAAKDNIGVAEYRLYLNGVLLTNVLGNSLSYQFDVNLHDRTDLRIQAADAAGNTTVLFSLAYLPGDGLIAVSDDSGRVYLVQVQTDGSFGAARQLYNFGAGERGLGLGDFDRDGILDLIAGHGSGSTMSPYFFKGKGDGTFAAPVALPTAQGSGGWMMDATVGDFDGDGNLDFVVNSNDRYVFFYWGNGDGTFTVDVKDWGCCGRGMAAGDFNEDGREDLARARYGDGQLRVFLSNGDRTFIETNLVAQNLGNNDPYAVAAGDFDEDGHLDIIVAGGNGGDVSFFKGLGDGAFINITGTNGLWSNLDINTYSGIDAFDYNGDRHLDLVMSGYNGQAYFFAGNGDGTFSTNRLTLITGMSGSMGISAPPKPPRVGVGISPADPVTNLNGSIDFTAVGSGVSSADFFRWTFGDQGSNRLAWTFTTNMTNMGQTLSHTYTNEGRFLTRLWHTSAAGTNSVRGTWVTIQGAAPVAEPGGPYSHGEAVATQAVWYATLDGSASTDDFGIAHYIWSFGDGTSVTNSTPKAFHGWTNAGVWSVRLTVVDASGQTNAKATTVTFTPGALPVAAITGTNFLDESAAHSGVWSGTFYGTNSTDDFGIWKYAWRASNGQTGNNSSFQPTFSAVGTNVITLTVTDNANQTNSTTQTVVVKANAAPVPAITGPNLLTEDVATNGLWYGTWNSLASTDDTGIYQYNWNFGDGSTATGTNVAHSYASQGIYSLVLTARDNGNQSATVTQKVIVVAGDPPVARITANTLAPEGAQPVVFSARNSTDDHGIYLYQWLFPPRLFDLAGQAIDTNQWRVTHTVQNDKFIVTGQGGWGNSSFFSLATQVARGSSMQGRVDTSSTGGSYAMIGLRDLDLSSGNYSHLEHALYFNNGSVQIYELGTYRGQPLSYTPGNSYDFRIESKPGSGARYYLRPSGTAQPLALIFETSNTSSDSQLGFGADVYAGVFGFDDIQVQSTSPYRDVTTPVFPGGTVTLVVTDNALQTNMTSVVIAPVTGAPPTAVIKGPTNGLAGVELALDGYGSSDDYAIASYTWNFGDGTPAAFGPAVTHHYNLPGTYTNTLTVMDWANQSSLASLAITIAGSNALVCVPWKIINGIEQPHEVYAGKTNTLKAVARGVPLPFLYVWDYGDGTGSVTNGVTNAAVVYNLEARHAYSGSDGTPYYATARVYLTNGTVLVGTYPLVLRPKTLDTEMKVAIDEGLWYLQKTQNRYDFDAATKGGDWTDQGYKINATASSVQSFAINGHLMTDDASRDPYVDTVQRGVNYLLNSLATVNIGAQTYGDPDGNHNGIGLQANSGYPIYESGPLMDSLVAVGRPELVATTGGANVKGRLFKDIMQDLVDMYCWGQSDDATVGGGWRYGWNQGPDNSASQWGAIGMLAAEQLWGIPIPEWVKARNKVWVAYSLDGYGFGYTGPGGVGNGPNGDDASTPSALIQASFDGIAATNSLWVHGLSYIANYWSTLMNGNNVYANYSISKSLRTALPDPIHNLPTTGQDWFLDPTNGLARVTIDHQALNGSWTSSRWVVEGHATPWSVLILSSSLFQQGPVAVISVAPNPSAIGYPVVFDARGSYHQHPAYKIVEYRWVFDASKGVDFDHPDATGPVVTNVFGALSTNTIWLQVRDNGTPQLRDTASVVVRTTVPPYPPAADAGGPYVACVGADVHLDGSGSFCVDAAAGNFIQSWDWEIDFALPLDFLDGVAGPHAVITNGFPLSGAHQVGLRVKNANSLVYTNFGLPDTTSDAFTTVYVYDRLIADLRGRPKDKKCQLTWTKAGDYGVIMRSPFGPDRGFVEVGRTDSSYATFLDTTIDYNTEYYYRIYAYQTGRPDPIGVSDPVFVVSPPRSFDEHAPHFQSTPVRLAKVGELYQVALDAKDLENKPLYFARLLGPTNLTVNPTNGVVNFIPTPQQLGNQPVSFQVTNNIGRDVLSYTIFVLPATNHTPVANIGGPYTALIGQSIQFSSAGTSDADGNPLRYFWNFGDGTLATNNNPVHIYAGVGDYLVTLFVNDGYGGTASAKTHAQITRPNRPPVLVMTNGPHYFVRLGETVTVDASGSYDLDGNPLTFTWVWGDGASTNNTAGTATHRYLESGNYPGNLTLGDNQGGATTNAFDVTVSPSNQTPVLTGVTVSTDSPYVMTVVTFDATAVIDPEGDALTFEWDFGDRTRTTGPLVTHVFTQIGDYTVTLKVNDDRGGTNVMAQTIHALNAPPVFVSNPPLLCRAGTNYSYTPQLTDLDEDTSTFVLVQGPATMSCDTNTGTLTWFPGTNNVGPNPVVLRAIDANGGSNDQAFTLVVTTPLGPQLDLAPTHIFLTNVVVESQTLALSGSVRVYLRNNGTDTVPVPFTVTLFVDANNDGAFDTNIDRVVGQGNFPAGLPAAQETWIELGVSGQALFKDSPISAFIDSQNVVPEYNEANNIRRSGFEVDTNTPPVVDLSAASLQADRTGLPALAVLTARLGNSGLVPIATNVPMAFYDGDPHSGGALIGVAHSTEVLSPGMFQNLSVNWTTPTISKHQVFVVADDTGNGTHLYAEITLSNNVFSTAVDLATLEPPTADAGADHTVYLGDTVVLNGHGSKDPQGKPLSYRWYWLSMPTASQAQLVGTNTASPSFVADAAGPYTFQLVVNNGILDCTNVSTVHITAVDTNVVYPPTIVSAPTFQAMLGVTYTYQMVATDPQHKPLHFRLGQAPAGMTVNTNAGLIQWNPTNTGSFFVQVIVDGIGGSAFQSYSLTAIAFTNLPPQFTSTPVGTATPGAAYAYTVAAVDPNNDPITYALTQKPSGMTINGQSGAIAWTPTTNQLGGNAVTVTASDNRGASATQAFTLVVLNAGVTGPVVQPIPDQTAVDPNLFATIPLDSYVADPGYPPSQITWKVTGTNLLRVTLDANRVATITYTPGARTAERLTFLATDPDGKSAFASTLFAVRGFDNPPVAALANLSDTTSTSVETGFFDLSGTADDPDTIDPVAYKVQLYQADGTFVADVTPGPVNAAGWHEGRVAAGRSLGKLDLTTVLNGAYTVLLTVQGGAQQATATGLLALNSELKIGQVKFAQQDLVLPVQGIGLQVARSYDSFNRNTADFGYSWTYTVSDIGVRFNEDRTIVQDLFEGEFSLRTGGSRDITIDMPDTGRRVTFSYSLVPSGLAKLRALWTPPPGVNASLVPTVSPIMISLWGLTYWQVAPIETAIDNFDFPGYILTTKDGTQYRIERENLGTHFIASDGGAIGSYAEAYGKAYLSRITRPDGSHTDFVRDGTLLKNIVQYDNANSRLKSILFQRDGQNRIAAVYTPENLDTNGTPVGPASVNYLYDAAGNLVRVRKLIDSTFPANPVYSTNTFIYAHPRFPHLLTEVIDGRGISVMRCEFDAAGRLVGTFDASGNAVRIVHDTSGRSETVYDRMGNPTTYTYDDKGRVASKTDALGNTSLHTHDDKGNTTSVTDALGNKTAFAYDPTGNLTAMTDPLGNTATFTYNASGMVLSMVDPLGRVTTNSFDSTGRMTENVNQLGQKVVYQYDAQGNGTTILDIRGNPTTSYGYDASGRPTLVTSPTGVQAQFGYDEHGFRSSSQLKWVNPNDTNDVRLLTARADFDDAGRVTNAVTLTGLATRTAFNDFNRPVQTVDARGNTNSNTYDIRGNLIETRSWDGRVSRTVFDANDRTVVQVKPCGPGEVAFGMLTTYDAAGRAVGAQLLSNVVVAIDLVTNGGVVRANSRFVSAGGILASNQASYDAAGRLIVKVDSQGGSTGYEYDAAGRQTAVIDVLGQRTESEYDAAGRQTLTRDATGREIHFLYDQLGRLVRTVFPDGSSTQTVRDDANNRQTVVDELGHAREVRLDNSGRIAAVALPPVADPLATNTLTSPIYGYDRDAYGNLLVLRDAKGRATHFTYNEFNQLIARQLPGGQVEHQTFDPYGQLSRATDFNGQVAEFAYDQLGRIARKSLYATGSNAPSQVVTMAYGPMSRPTQIVDARGVTAFTYDTPGRLVRLATPEGTLNYQYDDFTGRKARTYTDNSDTRYAYDAKGRLQTVTVVKRAGQVLAQPEVTTYTYDAIGNRQTMVLPNGVRTRYQYDDRYRLAGLAQLDAASNLLASYSYSLNAKGQRTAIQEIKRAAGSSALSTNTFAFAYDALGRLVGETNGFAQTNRYGFASQYTYDLAGNRLQRKVTVAGKTLTTSYAYDVNDRLLLESNSVAAGASAPIPVPAGRPTGANRLLLRHQPAAWCYYAFQALPYALLAAFLLPAAFLVRRRQRQTLRILSVDLCPQRSLLPRCLSALLAALMTILCFDLRVLAGEAAAYAALQTDTWGMDGSVTRYQYDANGSVTKKVTTGPRAQTIDYAYDLEKRLASVTTTAANGGGQTVVEITRYAYDQSGNRVRSESHTLVNGSQTSAATNIFLVDPATLTGLAQVLEELPAVGAAPTRCYTIGDEVIAQTDSAGGSSTTEYLLRDGHNSVRQVVDAAGALVDSYAFDAFGVMLGDSLAASAARTALLYTGEYFDASLHQYNLRARNYDPGIGRFTSMDPLIGSPDEPATLHKYVYASSDPVNRIDPTGQQDLAEVMAVVCIVGILATLANSYYNASNGNSPFPDAAMWGISGSISIPGTMAYGAAYPVMGAAALFSWLSGNKIEEQISETLGRSFGAALFAGFVDGVAAGLGAASSIAQLTYSVGLEMLACARDRTLSEWFYHGPGINLGLSTSIGFSATLYGGTVWKVPTWDSYAGPFISFATTFGLGEYGLTVGYFYSASDREQNGVLTGATLSGDPIPLWSGVGGSYLYYDPIWHTDSAGTSTAIGIGFDALLALTIPLGYGPILILKSHRLL